MPDVVGTTLESSKTGLSIEYAVDVDGDLLLFVKRFTKLSAVESFFSLLVLRVVADSGGGPSVLLRLKRLSMWRVLLQFDKLEPVDGCTLFRGGRSGGGCSVF